MKKRRRGEYASSAIAASLTAPANVGPWVGTYNASLLPRCWLREQHFSLSSLTPPTSGVHWERDNRCPAYRKISIAITIDRVFFFFCSFSGRTVNCPIYRFVSERSHVTAIATVNYDPARVTHAIIGRWRRIDGLRSRWKRRSYSRVFLLLDWEHGARRCARRPKDRSLRARLTIIRASRLPI